MKSNYTDITVILDRSGSMGTIAQDTIGGYNQFLKSQREEPGSCTWTLHQFDDQYETVVNAVPISQAPALTDKTFVPRGSTALLDAIGRSVASTGDRLAKMPEGERPSRVICVIITDGEENFSHEFTAPQIQEKIREQETKYNWQFIFIGANQDAITSAARMGIKAGSSISYAANSVGTRRVFDSADKMVKAYRSGETLDCSFTTGDRLAQVQAGAAPDSITATLPQEPNP